VRSRLSLLRAAFAGTAALAVLAATGGPAVADKTRDRQWYLTALDVAKAHRLTRGEGVTVALIDTGVDAKHRDLAGAILPGEDLYEYPEGDGTGRYDLLGHGTQMAGVIAARGHGSSDGILGLAPAAKILPVRVIDIGFGDADTIAKAISYAVAHHAGVINMSFGGSDDPYLHDAIRQAQAADVVLVAAAGNRGAAGNNYPGRYPEVLTVGADDEHGKIAARSVQGPQVDLVAPGVHIATTGTNSSGYFLGSGTSEATAVVSGAAALIRARYPKLSAAEVVHRLTATATDAGPAGRDDTYGYGRLNLIAALTADVPVQAAASSSARPDEVAASRPTSDASGSRTGLAVAVAAGAAAAALLIGLAVLVRRRNRAR
jgi:type VII secretion-associated serine protease mycosin